MRALSREGAPLLRFLCACIISLTAGQPPQPEETLRTTSSVDVQVCVDGVLSTERDAVQQATQATLTAALSSSAVYAVRRYTTASGAACFLFVYQAPSPEGARTAAARLGQLAAGGDGLPIVYRNTQIRGSYEAVPWRGEEPPPVAGAPSVGTLILWGGVGGGVLLACLVGTCCFALLSDARERRRADAILAADRELLLKIKPGSK